MTKLTVHTANPIEADNILRPRLDRASRTIIEHLVRDFRDPETDYNKFYAYAAQLELIETMREDLGRDLRKLRETTQKDIANASNSS